MELRRNRIEPFATARQYLIFTGPFLLLNEVPKLRYGPFKRSDHAVHPNKAWSIFSDQDDD
jgi:hypothetical protein